MQRVADTERRARKRLDAGEADRRAAGDSVRRAVVKLLPQPLGELSGVDTDGTSRGAEAVDRAGVESEVLPVLLQLFPRGARGLPARSQPRHLPPHHDPLPRRQRQLAARAARLAETALDASVYFFFDGGDPLAVCPG